MAEKATQTIPPGYKQTEVGLIPGDWEIKECGELGSFYKGKGISSKNLVSDGLPCIMYGDIYVKFDTKFSNPDFRITKQTAANSSLAKTGDLFFTGSGETAEEIGKCVVYQGNDDIYIGGDIIALTPNSDNDSLFLAYMQNSKMLLSQKANLGQGHTVVHIYTEHIKSLKIPLPPTKTEQTAIASVLSDVDALIEKLEKLVAKKRAIKRGAMQELLAGKRRLPGFSGMWEVKKMGDVSAIKTGKKNNEDKVKNGQYPFFVRSQTVERINTYSFDGEAILVPGEGGIGSIFHYVNDKFDYHQRVYKISDFHENMCGKFIYYCMIQTFYKQAMRNSVKATVDSLRLPTFVEFEFLVPSFEEQTAITQVLSDVDAEIEELEQKLNKYEMIKQGMMQVLLTGKIRLI